MVEFITGERQDSEYVSRRRILAVDENGTQLSRGVFTFLESHFGREYLHIMRASAIFTPVHYRRGGNVRKMFAYMHDVAAEEGAAFACCHPFSFSYYNLFGYVKIADHLILRFPTRMIDFVPRRCNFVPYDETKLADMIAVYEKFSEGRNLLMRRFDDSFYVKEKQNTYICYENNTPIAYIVYETKKELIVNHLGNGVLTVHEIAYTSPAALKEIFSFLRMFEGELDNIEFINCAPCPEIDLMLRHYTHTSYTLVPDIAAKPICTKKLLCANDYPEKEGAFTVKVIDDMPSVAGVYRVEYGNRECDVRQLDNGAAPDLTLSSDAFMRLIFGYDGADATTAAYMDGVELDGRCEDFFRAFPKRPCGAFEHF